MTTKLEAINSMLECIGQSPLSTLEGTRSAFTVSAITLLDNETVNLQMKGWDFNTEENYVLQPDENKHIHIAEDMLLVKVPTYYKNRYVIRAGKIYDKYKHSFEIDDSIEVTVVFGFDFEDLPEVVKNYVKMSAAYKFTKRELGSQSTCIYTQEDLLEAKADMELHELTTGSYTMIPEYYNNDIKESL